MMMEAGSGRFVYKLRKARLLAMPEAKRKS